MNMTILFWGYIENDVYEDTYMASGTYVYVLLILLFKDACK